MILRDCRSAENRNCLGGNGPKTDLKEWYYLTRWERTRHLIPQHSCFMFNCPFWLSNCQVSRPTAKKPWGHDLKFMEVHSTPRRWILNLGTKWDVLFWSHCDLDFEPLQRLFGRAVSCALAPPLWPSRYCSPPWCQIHTGWGLTASGEC